MIKEAINASNSKGQFVFKKLSMIEYQFGQLEKTSPSNPICNQKQGLF